MRGPGRPGGVPLFYVEEVTLLSCPVHYPLQIGQENCHKLSTPGAVMANYSPIAVVPIPIKHYTDKNCETTTITAATSTGLYAECCDMVLGHQNQMIHSDPLLADKDYFLVVVQNH